MTCAGRGIVEKRRWCTYKSSSKQEKMGIQSAYPSKFKPFYRQSFDAEKAAKGPGCPSRPQPGQWLFSSRFAATPGAAWRQAGSGMNAFRTADPQQTAPRTLRRPRGSMRALQGGGPHACGILFAAFCLRPQVLSGSQMFHTSPARNLNLGRLLRGKGTNGGNARCKRAVKHGCWVLWWGYC